MSGDLSARLDAALRRQEQHEEGTRPDAATLADLHARVARARRGRAVSYAAVAAAAAGLLGVAGWFGLHRAPAPQPAHTPTPTSTATPSPTPSPSGDAAPTAPAAPEVPLVEVERTGAPVLHALPPGVLEAATTGWTLAQYGPVDQVGLRDVAGLLALLSPTGTAYLVADLDVPGLWVVGWEPGSTVATVVIPTSDRLGYERGRIDLLTGAVTREPAGLGTLGDADAYVGLRDDGAELWWTTVADYRLELVAVTVGRPVGSLGVRVRSGEHRGATMSPDGRRLALPTFSERYDALGGYLGDSTLLVDLHTGATSDLLLDQDAGECAVVTWTDARTVLASCSRHADVADPDSDAADVLATWWAEVTLDGDVRVLDAPGGAGTAATSGGRTVVVLPAGEGGGVVVKPWQPGTGPGPVAVSLDGPRVALAVHAAGAGRVAVQLGIAPEDPAPVELWLLDATTGGTVLVGPAGDGPRALAVTAALVAP
ncbi:MULTISPECIES: hypothetical protein [Cellulomonas]|uniref:Lipoprotein LpqB beta-propeller domain-containing protein n=1 Tax=Cellulomonas iranensis TaxID=76862 RepID=A0ABU0GKA6_9CELL|nr:MULTISPECIES: hypothetical protein [Cellulomonas]MDQ0425349.1 hypothetical protein [Cellulomonas iranensis]TFH71124.1 hypothetical protein E4A51_09705 [Cellulomonas sp. HD19AZ1]